MAALTLPQISFVLILVFDLCQSNSWSPGWNQQQSSYATKTAYYNTVPFTRNPQLGYTPRQQHQAPYIPLVRPQPQFEPLFLPAPPGQTPSCAKEGATYCEIVDNYPKKVILRLLQQGQFDLNTLLQNEKLLAPQKPVYPAEPEPTYAPPATQNYYNKPTQYGYPATQIYNKPQYRHDLEENITLVDETDATRRNWNGSSNNIPSFPGNGWRGKRQTFGAATLCDQRAGSRIVFAARNTEGQWKFVVNLPEIGAALTQRISTQECVNPNGGCRTDLCSPPSNVQTQCVQQIVQTRLVSLHPSGSRLTNEVFQLPSACVCSFSFG